jgi:hypothetical protein
MCFSRLAEVTFSGHQRGSRRFFGDYGAFSATASLLKFNLELCVTIRKKVTSACDDGRVTNLTTTKDPHTCCMQHKHHQHSTTLMSTSRVLLFKDHTGMGFLIFYTTNHTFAQHTPTSNSNSCTRTPISIAINGPIRKPITTLYRIQWAKYVEKSHNYRFVDIYQFVTVTEVCLHKQKQT